MKVALRATSALAVAIAFAVAGCSADTGTPPASTPEQAQSGNPGKAAKPKAEAPKETTAQANARESAASYLEVSGFSKKGLIDQLRFEGFSRADAKYGVNALKVNWKKQAARSAKDYQDMDAALSRQGMIDQLMFEGYTREQAEHGADSVGL